MSRVCTLLMAGCPELRSIRKRERSSGQATTLPLDLFQSMHMTFCLTVSVLREERRPQKHIILPTESHLKSTRLWGSKVYLLKRKNLFSRIYLHEDDRPASLSTEEGSRNQQNRELTKCQASFMLRSTPGSLSQFISNVYASNHQPSKLLAGVKYNLYGFPRRKGYKNLVSTCFLLREVRESTKWYSQKIYQYFQFSQSNHCFASFHGGITPT